MVEVRLLIVADNLLTRAGLAALLTEQSDYEVVGQVDGGATLADDLDVYQPDVLVWDFGWQPKTSVERLSSLVEEIGENDMLPVVILLPDEAHVTEVASLLRLMRAGAIFLRDSGTEPLVNGLAAVAQGLIVLDPMLAEYILPGDENPPEALTESLTARELEVLQLLAEGLANKTIARRLGISDHTVKFHVNAIMGKLDAQSRTGAVVKATRLGLIVL